MANLYLIHTFLYHLILLKWQLCLWWGPSCSWNHHLLKYMFSCEIGYKNVWIKPFKLATNYHSFSECYWNKIFQCFLKNAWSFMWLSSSHKWVISIYPFHLYVFHLTPIHPLALEYFISVCAEGNLSSCCASNCILHKISTIRLSIFLLLLYPALFLRAGAHKSETKQSPGVAILPDHKVRLKILKR